MLDFFLTLSERGKLFVLVLFLSIITILLSLLIGGWWATSLVIVPAILGILQVTKGIWTPEEGGKSKIGLASLGVALAAILSSQLWKPFINSFLEPLYNAFPLLKDKLPAESPSIFALLFLTAVILIVNYFARDKTAMKEHSTSVEKEFPEKDYKKLLDAFSGILLDDLNKIDRETNWSAEIFTPLDAEVEIKTGSKRLKKVTDLLTAIRSDRRSRVFLVLGDPGSGKSVALRKLCRDLLKEVRKTGKVPLYVNLREWETDKIWTEKTPPTVDELYNFVLNNLKNRGDVFTNEFLDRYFKKMFENGRLFIVLDSFDEIPSVMDVDEKSWLIDSLSDVIYRFLGGSHESRGILASRIFRRPTDKFDAKTIFEIRPFTENKIVESLKKSLFYDESLITLLFNQRQELIPIARNPFTAALIASYAKDHNNTLPQNQSELYSSYIERRLDNCKERMAKKNLTNEKVINGAIEIADLMLTTQAFGLEASVNDLKAGIPRKSIENIIDILRYARLGRLGGGDEQRFSFVHRRFNEYFVVQRLIELPDKVPQDAIPTDSRWRDALVLYCEVAREEEARKIAEFCWSEVSKLTQGDIDLRDPQYLRSIHCLRFLKEAFRARLNCIDSFRDELADFILTQIKAKPNLLSLKLAVEAVGLLKEKDIDTALVNALEINNPWINETALKSCHYLPVLSKNLNDRLMFTLESIDFLTFFKRRREIIFSLKLSNIFFNLKRYCIWRITDYYFLLLAFFLFFLLSPIVCLFICFILGVFIYSNFDSVKIRHTISSSRMLWDVLLVQNYERIVIGVSLIWISLSPFLAQSSNQIDSWGLFVDRLLNYSLINYFFQFSFIKPSLAALGIILILPFYKFFYFAAPLVQTIKIKSFLLLIGGVIAISGIGFLAFIILPLIILKIFIITVFSVTTIFTLYMGSSMFKEEWQDFIMLRKILILPNLTREEISEQFDKFRTRDSRLEYVKRIQNEGVKPTGTWLYGKIPNYMNDEASTLLAQLEEKWLGLDK